MHLFLVQRVHDRRGHAGAGGHGQEGTVQGVPVRQAEGDVRGAAGGVDLELLAQAADQAEGGDAGTAQGADRHDQGVDHHVGARDAMVLGPLDDLPGNLVAHVRVLGDAGFVVRDRDHGGAVLPDQRQHRFEALFLTGHGVDQGLALIDLQALLQGLDDRGVDRNRHVDQRLHQLDRVGQDPRLVGQRDAGIDVEHGGAGGNLGQGVGLDRAVVAGGHFSGELLAAGRVDALADHAERLIEADDDFLLVRTDQCVGHDPPVPLPAAKSRGPIRQPANPPIPDRGPPIDPRPCAAKLA